MTQITWTRDEAQGCQRIVIEISDGDIARLSDDLSRAFLTQPFEHPADVALAAEYVLRKVLPPLESEQP